MTHRDYRMPCYSTKGVVAGQQITSQSLGPLVVLVNILSLQTIFNSGEVFLFVFADKCKRFLQEFYSEDDNGKKVFKYGAQLVSIVFK